jgi:hypothetical protein
MTKPRNTGGLNWYLWEDFINTKGQSLIELIMVLPIIIAFLAAVVWFAQAFIISIELMHTARHGIFWLAYNDDRSISQEQETQLIENECRNFLHSQASSLDMNRVKFPTVQPGDRWTPLGPRNLLDIPGLIDMVIHIRSHLREAVDLINFRPASIKVEYDMPTPPLLLIIPGFPPSIPLRGYCVCYR